MKQKKQKVKGIKGNYVLNQKSQKFAHRNEKRLKTRAAKFRAEIRLDSAA